MPQSIEITTNRLLNAKFRIPRSEQTIRRARLTTRIESGLRRPVTLLSAPAGSGKTTLISSWARDTDRTVAWLSLDEDDNEPNRFLTYLSSSLCHVIPDLGGETCRLLYSSYPPPPLATAAAFVGEIEDANLTSQLVVVLDDFHVIDDSVIHEIIEFLIEHMPPCVRLLISSRADPSLPLARLRARTQLTEIRGNDLRFTSDEAAELLQELIGADLGSVEIAKLNERTEGWAAGLVLAGLALQGRSDQSGSISSVSGSHRFFLDYLVHEVLACQHSEVNRFLLYTSILEQFNAGLSEALLGSATRPLIERIEKTNLFLSPLDDDGNWYRYHQLFREALQHELTLQFPEIVPELHRKAADWYERNDCDDNALSHVWEIPDLVRAADIVERNAGEMLGRGEVRTIRQWIEALPEDVVKSRPELGLAHAWALAHANALDAVEPRLRAIEEWSVTQSGDQQTLKGRIAAVRARVAVTRGELEKTIELSQLALSLLPVEFVQNRAGIGLNLGGTYGAVGDLPAAHRAYEDVIALGPAAGPLAPALAFRYKAALMAIQGNLDEAQRLYDRALEFVSDQQAGDLPAMGIISEGLAELAYFRNDLDRAETLARDAVARGERGGEVVKIAVPALYILARTLQSRGDSDGAIDATERNVALSNSLHARAWRARIWLRQGRKADAIRWARTDELSPSDPVVTGREIELATLARVLHVEGRLDEAADLLDRLISESERLGRPLRTIENLVVRALVFQSAGNVDEAVSTLERALLLAIDERHVRIIVDEGPALAPLLTRIRALARRANDPDRRRLGPYAEDLLASLAMESGPHLATSNGKTLLIEPLSDREREVLSLIAAGRTNREIASDLYVSLGTVKAHTNHVFTKLGVRGRTEAIARARELELLA